MLKHFIISTSGYTHLFIAIDLHIYTLGLVVNTRNNENKLKNETIVKY